MTHDPFGGRTPEEQALEAALRANEMRYSSEEIDLPEYQAGIDKARRAYRIATEQATDWKAVADDLYDIGADYAIEAGGYEDFRRAYLRAVSEHTEKP